MGDAQRRLVEDGVAAGDEPAHQRLVADVAVDELDLAALQRAGEVADAAADHVVDDDDLAGAEGDELVDDVRADEAGAAGDEDALAGEMLFCTLLLLLTPASRLSATMVLTASMTRATSASPQLGIERQRQGLARQRLGDRERALAASRGGRRRAAGGPASGSACSVETPSCWSRARIAARSAVRTA